MNVLGGYVELAVILNTVPISNVYCQIIWCKYIFYNSFTNRKCITIYVVEGYLSFIPIVLGSGSFKHNNVECILFQNSVQGFKVEYTNCVQKISVCFVYLYLRDHRQKITLTHTSKIFTGCHLDSSYFKITYVLNMCRIS